MSRVVMITGRAEACLEAIELTLSAPRPTDAAGGYARREQVITNLRAIKAKAIEAEVLLRSLDYDFRGGSSIRATASQTGDPVSNPAPAPLSDGGVESKTRKELSADAQSLIAAGPQGLGVAPGPSDIFSDLEVMR